MKRITIAVLGLVVGSVTGCIDMGLDGNIPLEEAEDRPPLDLVAAVYNPTESVSQRVIVDGRLWIPSGLPLTVARTDLRAVGTADGRTVYARSWDRPPYGALVMELPTEPRAMTPVARLNREEWVELQPVLGRSGPVPDPVAPGAPAGPDDHGSH